MPLTKKIRIEDLVTEQYDKVYGELNGGIKYGADLNKLKAIMKYHQDKGRIDILVGALEDETLKAKVKLWMVGAEIEV